MCDLFIFAGEASGDTHGQSLVQEILKLRPDLKISGVAGPKMRKEGVKPILKMEDFQVMGFQDVFLALPGLISKFFQVRDWILQNKPKAVVLIDYPGFNLRLAKALKKGGFKGKVLHYICPSVWAWGKGRIKTLAKYVDELYTIYPFEKKYFENTPLSVHYIGNPVVETLKKTPLNPEWKKLSGLPETFQGPLIALFPGSRKQEIEKNLNLQLEAAEKIKEAIPHAEFALSVTSPKIQAVISEYLSKSKLKIPIVPSCFNYELMKESQAAIAKSGTITLELALSKCPTTVIYGVSPLNRFIAKYLIRLKLPYFCIVNILKNEEVFPELIEKGFNADALTLKSLALLEDEAVKTKTLTGCQEVIDILGDSHASEIAAKHVVAKCS
ncbi:MAG: lipid-A-disaccharide synthase [Chlamydiia bacterium]|nr:lipid-A-disaccharide synthase [Chlamydiia bacterium]